MAYLKSFGSKILYDQPGEFPVISQGAAETESKAIVSELRFA